MSNYENAYSDEKSLNFIVPIAMIVLLGVVYIMTQKSGIGFVSFFLIGAAAVTIFYWNSIVKKMILSKKAKYKKTQQETKSWVYDLIKSDDEIVFVAEVPGPEDKIMVRLIESVLYIRGAGNFSKELTIENAKQMEIGDFKYRNGVLTLRIKTIKA